MKGLNIFKRIKEKSPDWYRKNEFEIKNKLEKKTSMAFSFVAGGKYDYDLYYKNKKIAKIYLRWKHQSWGNAINLEWEKQSGHGFLSDMPSEGDLLLLKMAKGGIAVMSFTELKHCGDPKDMFFFKVLEVGYLDQQLKVNMSEKIKKELNKPED